MDEYRFHTFFFRKDTRYSNLGEDITQVVAEAQKEGFEYHNVRFAQSSASGTGMSALLVLRKTNV